MTPLGQGFPRQPVCKARLPRTPEKAPEPGEWPRPRCSSVVSPHPAPARVRAPSPPSTAWAGLAKPTLHWTSGRDPAGGPAPEARVVSRPCHWLETTNGGAGAWPDPALPLAGKLVTAGRGRIRPCHWLES